MRRDEAANVGLARFKLDRHHEPAQRQRS
jgi:hypothetical protein